MTTYSMTTCHFCYGFGIELTPNEIAVLRQIAVQAARDEKEYTKPVLDMPGGVAGRPRCCCCKGTGWTFVNSRDARRNGIPQHCVNRFKGHL